MSEITHRTPAETYAALRDQAEAVLVDVRTDAEWTYVGLPDLSAVDKPVHRIAWQLFPAMTVNEGFIDTMRAAGITPGHHIHFLCRSGVRSLAAAKLAVEAGFPHAINITDGFEGPPDEAGHRRTKAGWIASGLPWKQG
ncbi:rhodanese-like domain-containing protein [Elioraea sp.]|uniref:rhodanese-like domain-containing protein n=1 Tax=Elioraea sp. TaxID=2185103 RepID=UPI0025BD9F7D|nr:rhodanese-like domain-containing protein [Elioraea sp.]